MRHPTPRRPSWARATGSRTRCSCPRASPTWAWWSCTAPARRRRATSTSRAAAATTGMAALAYDARGHGALRGRASGRARSDDALAMVGAAARARARGWRCAARAWAASRPSTPPRATRRVCAVVAICPAPEDLLLRLPSRRGPERFRCDVEATEAWLESLDVYDAVGRARARTRRCSCSTRAATSRCPTRSARSCTRRRTSPSGCWSCPAATTARSSTTWSSRPSSRRFIRDAARRAATALLRIDSRLGSGRCPRRPTWSSSRSCARRCSSWCCWPWPAAWWAPGSCSGGSPSSRTPWARPPSPAS